ncbi:hypothetical protein FWK35_00028935 [Aphis craccivora]|uniref:Uncharacterized protein n=1 Tax=Aphis craccivora TaxID=307492 RepID=A0A6G0VY68_APHCR|nr:hypothetical protein FWK35_00028935 [Aphis craccivora]
MTSCQVPFSDVKVVPLQFPFLSVEPAIVVENSFVSLIFIPVITPPSGR